MRAHLDELIDSAEFTRRHTAPTEQERRHMLAVIGEDSLESLLAHTVPDTIRMADTLELDRPRSPESVSPASAACCSRMPLRTAPSAGCPTPTFVIM